MSEFGQRLFALGLPVCCGFGQARFFRGFPLRLGLGQVLLRFGAQIGFELGEPGGGIFSLRDPGLMLGATVDLQVEQGRGPRNVVAIGIEAQYPNG